MDGSFFSGSYLDPPARIYTPAGSAINRISPAVMSVPADDWGE